MIFHDVNYITFPRVGLQNVFELYRFFAEKQKCRAIERTV